METQRDGVHSAGPRPNGRAGQQKPRTGPLAKLGWRTYSVQSHGLLQRKVNRHIAVSNETDRQTEDTVCHSRDAPVRACVRAWCVVSK